MKNAVETPFVFAVSASLNGFGLDLHRRLRSSDRNLFFSPASVATALAMIYFGSGGRTKDELASVLRLNLSEPLLVRAFVALDRLLDSEDGDCQLSVTNRLWEERTYPFRKEFLEVTRERFGAELARLDFSSPESARRVINDWISHKTGGRITDLVAPGTLDILTRLVLTSAVHFKGIWQDEFSEAATRDMPFHLSDGRTATVATMHRKGSYRCAEEEGFEILSLNYRGPFSMLVLLPRRIDGLNALEDRLTAEEINRLAFAGHDRTVGVWFPRFKIASRFRMTGVLRSMGLATAFSADADFTNIAEPSNEPSLALPEVVHEASVDVDERGTEAVAATVLNMLQGYAGGPTLGPVEFRADRPFLFLIRDTRTGVVLFSGSVTDPRTGE